jgi:hypothetical protein
MRKRPKTLVAFALFLVMVGLSFPIQVMMIYGHSPLEMESIFSKISSLNILVMALCFVSAITVYGAMTAAKVCVPMLLVAVGFNNGYVGSVGEDYSLVQTFAATVAFFAVHLNLLRSDILLLINEPEKRWWLTSPRKKVDLPMTLTAFKEQSIIRSRTFDLSERGTFIPFNQTLDPLTGLKVEDMLQICLNLGPLTPLRCEAKVVRIEEAKGLYPAGIGLEFTRMDFEEARRLKKYIRSQDVGLTG